MAHTTVRWALLFLFLILLPVSILTYRSVQSLRDERESVLQEQQLLADLLQDAFDEQLDSITKMITYFTFR